MVTTVYFDVAAFRVQFTEFASSTTYTDVALTAYFDTATAYISNNSGAWSVFTQAQIVLALNLMTAHLARIYTLIATGQNTVLMQGSTVDKVSITLTPPPVKNQFQWWLSTTPYGAQLLSLLQLVSVGGFYVGGRPELSAFRRVC